MGEHDLTARHPPSLRRAGCLANGHVRFGRRAAETDQRRLWHRAAVRPHNLVHDPATLIVAFARVAGNQGANTPGVDGVTADYVEQEVGVPGFLDDLRAALKDGSFRPLPVRERMIPKPGGSGKLRRLGIPTEPANRPFAQGS